MLFSLRQHHLAREFLSEFLGTYILMVIGEGVLSQQTLSHGKLGSAVSNSATWGIAVMMGVYVSGGASGGHINPAVSVAMACLGRLPWYKVPAYYVAQCLGAFAASGTVFLVYWEALDAFDDGSRQTEGRNATAGIWATYPAAHASVYTNIGDQIFATAVLLICVCAITDPRNLNPGPGLFPICVGLLVTAMGTAFSLNCGNAMNPARDFIPRLFTVLAGWGQRPISIRDYNFFWVTIVGPHIGALLGVFVYQAFVGWHWPLLQSEGVNIGEEAPDVNHLFTDKTGLESADKIKHPSLRASSNGNNIYSVAVVNKAFELQQEATHM